MKKLTVWVFNDGRPGTFNQALAVAEALDWPFEVQDISYNQWAKLPNILRGKTSLGISKNTIANLASKECPDIIISAGRRCVPLCRYIKKQSRNKTQIVQIMGCGNFALDDFLLLVIPEHDKFRKPKADNVLRIIGAPHRVNKNKLAEAKSVWFERFSSYPAPFTGLIVGGSTKNKIFTDEMAFDLISKANKLMERFDNKGSLLITTSRRTGKSQEDIIKKYAPKSSYIYAWGDEGENPYFGILALADKIIVTGDSVSMVSEVCATNALVYVYDNKGLLSSKHKRFLNSVYTNKYAFSLNDPLSGTEHAAHISLNAAKNIAAEIKKRLELQK